MIMNMEKNTKSMSDECRICLSNDNSQDLIHPCKCNGTIKYVHNTCLYHLRSCSYNNYRRCSTCKEKYKLTYTTINSFIYYIFRKRKNCLIFSNIFMLYFMISLQIDLYYTYTTYYYFPKNIYKIIFYNFWMKDMVYTFFVNMLCSVAFALPLSVITYYVNKWNSIFKFILGLFLIYATSIIIEIYLYFTYINIEDINSYVSFLCFIIIAYCFVDLTFEKITYYITKRVSKYCIKNETVLSLSK